MSSTRINRICGALEFDPQANPRPDLAHEWTRAREEHPPPSVARTSWSQRTCNVLSRQGFPAAHFADLWAGCGNGATCVRCSEAIKSDHVEYELRFRQGVAITSIQLHRECWEIWWRD